MTHLHKNVLKCVAMAKDSFYNVMMVIILMEMDVQKIVVLKVVIHAVVDLMMVKIIVIHINHKT
jgi:hypothetical protein